MVLCIVYCIKKSFVNPLTYNSYRGSYAPMGMADRSKGPYLSPMVLKSGW